ncbi:TPA: phage head-binding domain-containing protein [Escherichia coli]|nr:phage head-binding domain-containing protein [Escherichia coli]MCY6723034.1 phage head-binding domain-containing protein [Escherichia coli]MCY6846983.1 phage head-binding domain-containing protein [Escherichia coli]MCY6914990.1 phage head-binding domain-containing protein [Escherichia coli]
MSDITANVVVSMPSQLFTMARSFKAVANGKIYIGKIDTDPVNPENQIQVYVENEDGSHAPVSQPIIINAAGYPVYNGQIAKFVTVQGHSMAVYDAYGAQQFYFPNVLKYDPDQLRSELAQDYGPTIVNDAKIAVRQPFNGAVNRTQHQKNSETISVLDFKLDSDPDWTLSFNRASLVSAQLGKTIFVPAGEYEISDSILLYDLEDVYNEKYYQPNGSRFVGEGRASIIRKTAVGTQDINAVFYNKGKRGNVVRGLRILDDTTDSYGYYTPNTAVYQEFSDLFILAQKWGMYFGGNTFVGVSIREIVVQGSDATGIYGGIHIHGGTSYVVSQCNAFKTNYCAFELTGSYCEIGPLAADDCAGIPYIFNAGSYSISSLGCEQPSRQNNGTIIKGTGANLQIDNIHLYDQTQAAGSYMFDLSGYAKVSIKQLIASSTTTFNGAMARLTNGAKLEIVYSNKVETSWPQRNSYDTKTATFATLGNLGGLATIPTFSTTMCRDMALPNPDQSAGPYYRIVGGQYGRRGCIGTIYTLRSGEDLNPISGAYDLNTVGSNISTRAKLVRAAHCDNQSLTDYDAWFTGTYEGTSYLFIRMPTVGGYRNLGTFFSGVVFGQDRNMFKALLANEISNLTEYSGGKILTVQAQ